MNKFFGMNSIGKTPFDKSGFPAPFPQKPLSYWYGGIEWVIIIWGKYRSICLSFIYYESCRNSHRYYNRPLSAVTPHVIQNVAQAE